MTINGVFQCRIVTKSTVNISQLDNLKSRSCWTETCLETIHMIMIMICHVRSDNITWNEVHRGILFDRRLGSALQLRGIFPFARTQKYTNEDTSSDTTAFLISNLFDDDKLIWLWIKEHLDLITSTRLALGSASYHHFTCLPYTKTW